MANSRGLHLIIDHVRKVVVGVIVLASYPLPSQAASSQTGVSHGVLSGDSVGNSRGASGHILIDYGRRSLNSRAQDIHS